MSCYARPGIRQPSPVQALSLCGARGVPAPLQAHPRTPPHSFRNTDRWTCGRPDQRPTVDHRNRAHPEVPGRRGVGLRLGGREWGRGRRHLNHLFVTLPRMIVARAWRCHRCGKPLHDQYGVHTALPWAILPTSVSRPPGRPHRSRMRPSRCPRRSRGLRCGFTRPPECPGSGVGLPGRIRNGAAGSPLSNATQAAAFPPRRSPYSRGAALSFGRPSGNSTLMRAPSAAE